MSCESEAMKKIRRKPTISEKSQKPIRVYPKMSTGLWDGAFLVVCIYRSDGERMTSSLRFCDLGGSCTRKISTINKDMQLRHVYLLQRTDRCAEVPES